MVRMSHRHKTYHRGLLTSREQMQGGGLKAISLRLSTPAVCSPLSSGAKALCPQHLGSDPQAPCLLWLLGSRGGAGISGHRDVPQVPTPLSEIPGTAVRVWEPMTSQRL